MYLIYAQIGFSTNRQTFNKNIATAKNFQFLRRTNHNTKPLSATLKLNFTK
jgi:sulfur carrier protein ThiS